MAMIISCSASPPSGWALMRARFLALAFTAAFERLDLALADLADRALGQEQFRGFLNQRHHARSFMIEFSSAA